MAMEVPENFLFHHSDTSDLDKARSFMGNFAYLPLGKLPNLGKAVTI